MASNLRSRLLFLFEGGAGASENPAHLPKAAQLTGEIELCEASLSPAHLPGLTGWTQMQIIPGPNDFRSQGLARSLAGRWSSHSQRLADLMLLGTRLLAGEQVRWKALGAGMTAPGPSRPQGQCK